MEILVWLLILIMCQGAEKKNYYVLTLYGSSLTLWILLGLGRDMMAVSILG